MSAPSGLWLTDGRLSRKWLPAALLAVVGFSVAGSLVLDWKRGDDAMLAMARERGAALFRLVELASDWNAQLGGVYAPAPPDSKSRADPGHPRHDVVTRTGQTLTAVNHAAMIRQIAELARQAEGVQLHLANLKPILPANGADDWEAEALRRFEDGLDEIVELIPGAVPAYRYMAPLKLGEPCLACHDKQGHPPGQFHGGISITMPAAHLLAIRDAELVRSSAAHALVLAVMLALLHLLVAGNRRHVMVLEALAAEQERVIVERTHALSIANHELELRLADRELTAAVFDNAAEAIIVTDEAGLIVQVNPAFSRITGFAAREVLGKAASLLKSGRHSRQFFARMWRALKGEGRWQGEVWNRRANGEIFAVWLSIIRIAGGGQPARFVATLTDITRRKELEEDLRHQAYHDPLTDLPNRALFVDRLRVAVLQARRHGRTFALCFIDLDCFKPVNDKFGHAAGDDLLVETARRLRLSVRATDTIARLGGDEFAAILAEAGSREEVEEVAARIVADLARPFELRAGIANISCSVGIALFPEHGSDVEALQRNADFALYEVKELGRNAYRIHVNGLG